MEDGMRSIVVAAVAAVVWVHFGVPARAEVQALSPDPGLRSFSEAAAALPSQPADGGQATEEPGPLTGAEREAFLDFMAQEERRALIHHCVEQGEGDLADCHRMVEDFLGPVESIAEPPAVTRPAQSAGENGVTVVRPQR
jgi:hypothetical protein